MTKTDLDQIRTMIAEAIAPCRDCQAHAKEQRVREEQRRHHEVRALPPTDRLAAIKKMTAAERTTCLETITVDHVVEMVRDVSHEDRRLVMAALPPAIHNDVELFLRPLVQYVRLRAVRKMGKTSKVYLGRVDGVDAMDLGLVREDGVVGGPSVDAALIAKVKEHAVDLGTTLEKEHGAVWWPGWDIARQGEWIWPEDGCKIARAIDQELDGYIESGAVSVERLDERNCRAIMRQVAEMERPRPANVFADSVRATITPGTYRASR